MPVPQPSTVTLETALQAARETRVLKIGSHLLSETPEIFAAQFGNRPAVIVADENTFSIAGSAVQAAFHSANHPSQPPFIFHDPKLYAEHHFVAELETALRAHDAVPIAVGSGTINDLTKLAAHRTRRPYVCVATAASMDGYTAFGASITQAGSKQTFHCPAPTVVIADLEIIRNAPPEMNAWGYADLLAKITAGADWILADALGVEPIDPQPWTIVQGRLRELTANPAAIRTGDPDAIGKLITGLLLGGFAMQSAQSSRPASGAEHQFSHLWDMQHHTHQGRAPSHGFKVGIGTLAVTALYEQLLAQPLEQLDVDACVAAWPTTESWINRARIGFGAGELLDCARRELTAKQPTPPQLREQLETLRHRWPALRELLPRQLLPFTELSQMLKAAGAPTAPEAIGITRERLRESYWLALCIRRRFTVLDVAARTGLLDRCCNEIFAPHGRWPTD